MTDPTEPELPELGDPADEASEPDLGGPPQPHPLDAGVDAGAVTTPVPPPPAGSTEPTSVSPPQPSDSRVTEPPAASPSGGDQARDGSTGAVPGWYPAPGGQRYWDGQQWTEHTVAGAAPMNENNVAMWAHLSSLIVNLAGCGILGFVGPLIIMNGQGKQSPYVRHHAVEALNFSLTILIAAVVSWILVLFIIGIFMLMVVGIGALVLQIIASMAANRGEWYRYPVNIRFVG